MVCTSRLARHRELEQLCVGDFTGSYWYQKGGEAHVTKCLAGHECLFFISQDSHFDVIVRPPPSLPDRPQMPSI